MASEVNICNIGLSRIGVDQLVEAFTDANNRARAASLHYGPTRDQVLSDFPWNFAQSVVALAEVSGITVPGYGFVYRYPSNCLRAQVVTDEGGARFSTGTSVFAGDIWDYAALPITKAVFTVLADPVTPGARIIACDVEQAFLWMTVKVEDTNQMSELFRNALSWRLAAEFALQLRADVRLYQNAQNMYLWSVSQGQVHSFSEEQQDPRQQSPSILARL